MSTTYTENSRLDRRSCAAFALIIVIAGVSIGCSSRAIPTTRPSTAQVRAGYEALFATAEAELRALHFEIARKDFRAGVIETAPMTSAQWFEPWRTEVQGIDQRSESSLATVRRTASIRIEERGAGVFVPRVSVRVERYSQAEARVSNVVRAQAALGRNAARGSREQDRGIFLPASYWYEVGFDDRLGRRLEESIVRKAQ